MLFTALFPVRVLRHLDLLDLRPQLLPCSVAVHSVGDVIPEAVAQHALAIRFPDSVALTQPPEGMGVKVQTPLPSLLENIHYYFVDWQQVMRYNNKKV